MIDKLIDFLISILDLFRFWDVIDDFSEGVVLRCGVFHRELKPGLHFIIPFCIEKVICDNVVPRTVKLGTQSLTTKDGRSVIVSGVVTARINNIRKALLEVEGMDDALKDSCGGEISRVIAESTWDQLHTGELSESLTQSCRKRGWRWGIEIMQVQMTDMTLAKSLRLWNA